MRNHLGYRVRRRFSAQAWLLVAIICLGQALLWLATVPTSATSDTVAPEATDLDVSVLAVVLGLLVSIALHLASGRRLLPWRSRR
jgi:succinate dehydrogenase/fumarate reductase cytochrome b subunit